MKNIFKMLAILLVTIGFASCKKKDPKPEVFDITKYSIVGKFSSGNPYIITIDADDKATLTAYGFSTGKYTFIDGVLKFNFSNGEVIGSFTIENGAIKSYAGPAIINTYDLVKIPATNQLEGKTFKGIWQNLAYTTEFKFTASQVTETTNNQSSVVNYTLINNLAVKKQNGAYHTLLVIIDNKLEGAHYNQGYAWGIFMRQ